MSIKHRASSILICDPDSSFLKSVEDDPRAKQDPPILVTTGKDAQLAIANEKRDIAAVFVSPEINISGIGPGWISVVRFTHQHRLATPIFLLSQKSSPIEEDELNKLAVQRALSKPISYSEMARLVLPESVFFDPDAAPETNEDRKEEIDKELTAEDSQFVPVRASTFISGTRSFFDVYIKLKSSKYVKLLQAGDDFSYERLRGYLEKGVKFFYLKKTAQLQYLSFCDQLTTRMLAEKKVPDKAVIKQTVAHGEETMSFLRNHGLSQQNIQYADAYIGNVQVLTERLKLADDDALKGFMENIASAEHSAATVIVSGLIARQMGITSDYAVDVVGIAALLHDIGLYRLMPERMDEDISLMTPGQKGMYQTHPIIGVKLLSKLPKLHQAAIQAVGQHHERRDETGFPMHLGSGAINRVAEIVGISDEIVRAIARSKAADKLTLEAAMKPVLGGFSNVLVEAYQTVFYSAGYKAKKKKAEPTDGEAA